MKKNDANVNGKSCDISVKAMVSRVKSLPKPICGVVAGAVVLIGVVFFWYFVFGDLHITGNDAALPDVSAENWVERKRDYYGWNYTYYYNSCPSMDVKDNLQLLKFSSKWKARHVYRMMKEGYSSYQTLTGEGENYYMGWEPGVCDAMIHNIVCLDGKMIIRAETDGRVIIPEADVVDPVGWANSSVEGYIITNFAD